MQRRSCRDRGEVGVGDDQPATSGCLAEHRQPGGDAVDRVAVDGLFGLDPVADDERLAIPGRDDIAELGPGGLPGKGLEVACLVVAAAVEAEKLELGSYRKKSPSLRLTLPVSWIWNSGALSASVLPLITVLPPTVERPTVERPTWAGPVSAASPTKANAWSPGSRLFALIRVRVILSASWVTSVIRSRPVLPTGLSWTRSRS